MSQAGSCSKHVSSGLKMSQAMMQPAQRKLKKKKLSLVDHHITVNLQVSDTTHSGSEHDANYKLN